MWVVNKLYFNLQYIGGSYVSIYDLLFILFKGCLILKVSGKSIASNV